MKTQREKQEVLLEQRVDTFPYYVQRFLRNNIGLKQPTTLLTYARDVEFFFEWVMREKFTDAEKMADVDIAVLERLYRDDIEDYRAYLRRQKTGDGEFVSVATLNRKISALKSLFKYLSLIDNRETRKPYLARNVMAQVPLLKNPEASEDNRLENLQSNILIDEEIQDFRLFVEEGYGETEEVKGNKRKTNRWLQNRERDAAIISLLLGSGLRIAELADITIKDLDLLSRRVRVYRKSGNKRAVPFSQTASDSLERYLAIRKERYKVDGKMEESLFVSLYGGEPRGMDKRSIQKLIGKYAEHFGKPEVTVHKLRHSFATNHMSKINSVPLLQKILDHANPGTTMIYNRVFDTDIQESIDKADK